MNVPFQMPSGLFLLVRSSDSDDADAFAIDTSNTIYCLHVNLTLIVLYLNFCALFLCLPVLHSQAKSAEIENQVQSCAQRWHHVTQRHRVRIPSFSCHLSFASAVSVTMYESGTSSNRWTALCCFDVMISPAFLRVLLPLSPINAPSCIRL